jgi:RNA polymerase sigma-70 factor, ECF subfamily
MRSASPIAPQDMLAGLGFAGRSLEQAANSDQALLQRIAARDQHAMRILFVRHRDATFRFILRLIRDEPVAEDVLIETFFAVWRYADRFEARSAFSTWLLAIARHKALSAVNRREAIFLDDETWSAFPDPADDPETALQSKDAGENLRRCLMRLSRKHTEVVDLVYYHDKTIGEVAQILKISQATVKTRMFYARRKLAQLLSAIA